MGLTERYVVMPCLRESHVISSVWVMVRSISWVRALLW